MDTPADTHTDAHASVVANLTNLPPSDPDGAVSALADAARQLQAMLPAGTGVRSIVDAIASARPAWISLANARIAAQYGLGILTTRPTIRAPGRSRKPQTPTGTPTGPLAGLEAFFVKRGPGRPRKPRPQAPLPQPPEVDERPAVIAAEDFIGVTDERPAIDPERWHAAIGFLRTRHDERQAAQVARIAARIRGATP